MPILIPETISYQLDILELQCSNLFEFSFVSCIFSPRNFFQSLLNFMNGLFCLKESLICIIQRIVIFLTQLFLSQFYNQNPSQHTT